MTASRVVLPISAVIAAALLVVIFFSERETVLVCNGSTTREGVYLGQPTATLSLREDRWWVGLWSSDDGSVVLQFDQPFSQLYFDEVRRINEGRLAVFNFTGGRHSGVYRRSSGEIEIRVSDGTEFTGRCVEE